MKCLLFLVIPVFAALGTLCAADAPSPPPKSKAQPSETSTVASNNKSQLEEVRPLELKNKSSFQMEGNNRNPFWPIGWKPSAKLDSGAEHAGPDIPVTAFVVSSITIEQGTKFAIINGKIMQEGQQFG